MLMRPRLGGADDARLFSPIDRQLGRAEACCATRLHFDEHDQRAPSRDQVDLDSAVADVLRLDAIPSLDQERRGTRFAFGSQFAARVGLR